MFRQLLLAIVLLGVAPMPSRAATPLRAEVCKDRSARQRPNVSCGSGFGRDQQQLLVIRLARY